MIKELIIQRIEKEESNLHIEDASGHIWWNKFRQFIEDIPDYEIDFAVRQYLDKQRKEINLDSET